MRFDDRDAPKKAKEKAEKLLKSLQADPNNEITRAVSFAGETRNCILEDSEHRLDNIFFLSGIKNYEQLNDHLMEFEMEGVSIKAEFDEVMGTWVVLKENSLQKQVINKAYSFIGELCQETDRGNTAVISGVERNENLVYTGVSEDEDDLIYIFEYMGDRVVGQLFLHMVPNGMVRFQFVTRLPD